MSNKQKFHFSFIISICHILANTLFCVACLAADEILDDVCKEKQISDEEFLAISSDEENDKTCYPSECIVEDWNQGKVERNKSKETLKQGYVIPQLLFSY